VKPFLLAPIFVVISLVAVHAQTITNTTLTETYTTASPGAKSWSQVSFQGTATLDVNTSASQSISDGPPAYMVQYLSGGLGTVDVANTGSGSFTLSLGGLNGGNNSSFPEIINFVTSATGGGTAKITTTTTLGRGGDGNDLTFWAFYDGNNYAATSTTSGLGTIESAGALNLYNDGGADTNATSLTSWAGDTSAAHNQDYKDDTTTAYSGVMTDSALEHGIRFANSAGATIDLGSFTLTDAGLLDAQGAGAVTIKDGNLTAAGLTSELIVNQNNLANNMTISANITGTTTFVKTGVGTLILNSSTGNTYNSPTNVDQGTLINDGTINSSATSIQLGATLGGTGTFGQLVTGITAGSILAPGDIATIGTLKLNGGLTASSGLTMDFKLNSAGQSDEINLGSSTLSLGGTVTIDFSNLGGVETTTPYTLMVGTGTWSGSPTFDFVAPTGYTVASDIFKKTSGADSLTVEFAEVPEPSTYAMMILGGCGVLGIGMRRAALRVS